MLTFDAFDEGEIDEGVSSFVFRNSTKKKASY